MIKLRRGDRVKPDDEVIVFDRNGTSVGQPLDGWPGKVNSKGPKWIYVSYAGANGRGRMDKFDYDGRSVSGFRHFERPEEYAARKREHDVRYALRKHGVVLDDFGKEKPTVEQMEAMLAALEKPRPLTFDQAAAVWVCRHYPDATPEVGSVSFAMDAAAYASSAWAKFEVSWQEVSSYGKAMPDGVRHVFRTETVHDSAWQYDASDLMRELLEISQ